MTPQQHYAEAERLMQESDRAWERGNHHEATDLVLSATAHATIALAAAASEIAQNTASLREP